jgi:hypothetical protein
MAGEIVCAIRFPRFPFYPRNIPFVHRGDTPMGQTFSPNFSLKKLPPGSAHGADAITPQFGDRRQNPVGPAGIDADGDVTSRTHIAFEDFARMQVRRRSQPNRGRRNGTPEWALNDKKLREVIVTYLEARVGRGRKNDRPDPPKAGSLVQRMNAVEHALRYELPARRCATMTKLCRELVEERKKTKPDEDRLRQLRIEIQNLDTTIRFERSAPAFVAAIVFYYYRAGMDSVGIGSEIGMSPMHIRQTLWRLNRIANRLANPKPPKEPKEKPAPVPKVRKVCAIEGCGKPVGPYRSRYCSEAHQIAGWMLNWKKRAREKRKTV